VAAVVAAVVAADKGAAFLMESATVVSRRESFSNAFAKADN
jgi:hypothetical protein